MRRQINKLNSLSAGWLGLVLGWLLLGCAQPVWAMSQDQKALINEGIYYTNAIDDCSTSNTPSGGAQSIYMVGDSIGERTKSALQSNITSSGGQFFADTLVSRNLSGGTALPDGLTAVEQDKSKIASADTVVVELGTNTLGFTAANVDSMIKKIRAANSSAAIYWVDTAVVDRPSYVQALDNVNSLIYGQSATDNYQIISWNKAVFGDSADPTKINPSAKDTKGYIDTSDAINVHPTIDKGVPALAALIQSSVSGSTAAAASTSSNCGGCTATGSLTSAGLSSSVPSPYNNIFIAAAAKHGIDPAILAAIFYGGEHGNSFPDPPPPYGHGGPWATSGSGAEGPFQFLPGTWATYAEDGGGDGKTNIQDLADAAFGAAHYLADLGATAGSSEDIVRTVAWKYTEGGGGKPEPHGDYANHVWAAFQKFSTGGSSNGCSSSLGSVTIHQNGAFGNADGLMHHKPTMVGIHYTAGHEQTVQDVINDLSDPNGTKHCNKSCSVQLTVLPDGSIYQLTSRLDVITENIINFNDADIGIEIAGPDEATLLNNKTQYNAVVALVAELMQQYNIKMQQDFLNKAGLMGHVECDSWSQNHIGTKFTGIYAQDYPVGTTDSHQDPGSTYMSKLRSALSAAGIS